MSEANPWVVQPPKQTAPIPDGSYIAIFKGVEECKIPKDEAVKVRWLWEIKSGEHKGKIASALTDRSVSSTTLPGRLLAGLLGRALVNGENVFDAINTCKGKDYLICIQPGPKGGKSCVRMVSKPPQM